MKTALTTRLERLEQASPVIYEAKRIDKIVLRGIGPDLKPVCESVFWTRPGNVEAANVS